MTCTNNQTERKDDPYCPKCYSLGVDFEWFDGSGSVPEYQWGVCHDCGYEWNECARESE